VLRPDELPRPNISGGSAIPAGARRGSLGTAPADRLYVRHAAAADRASWSVERDIPWASVDRAKALDDVELLALLRNAAIIESYHPIDVARLLRLTGDDIDARAMLSIDLYDGFKHFHALRTYLDLVGFEPAVSDADLLEARITSVADRVRPGELIERLVTFMLSEHFASYYFRRLGERSREPVLAEMLSLMAADDARHAQCASDLIARRIANDRGVIPRVLDAAARFNHFGEKSIRVVPATQPGDEIAIRAFVGRVERLCNVRLIDHIKASL
jgi:hypothetical protein